MYNDNDVWDSQGEKKKCLYKEETKHPHPGQKFKGVS